MPTASQSHNWRCTRIANFLKPLFKGDHVEVGVSMAYNSVLKFLEASPSGAVSQDDIIQFTTNSSNVVTTPTAVITGVSTAVKPSHLITDCSNQAIAGVFGAWVFAVLIYGILDRQKHSDWSIGKAVLRTTLFAIYLLTYVNPPLTCLASGSTGRWIVSSLQAAFMVIMFIPQVIAQHPTKPSDSEHGIRTASSQSARPTIATLFRKLWKLDQSDILTFQLYQFVVKLAQPSDQTQCNPAGQVTTWTAFALCVVGFKVKHYVVLRHDAHACLHTEISTRNVVKPAWKFVFVLLRTVLFVAVMLVSNPYPISCGLHSTSELRTLSYLHSGISLLISATASSALNVPKVA